MNKVTNITNKICPYARKVSIILRQKGSDFKEIQVDLQNKSQFFKESYVKAVGRKPNKDGLVPILIDENVYLSQSQPIVWYVAEKFQQQGYDVIPKNHVQRLKMRLFINQFASKIISVQSKYFGWSNKTQQEKNRQNQEAKEFWESLNNVLVLPYALGEQFTIADILIYSHLQLWGALQHFTGTGIDTKYEKVFKYIEEVQKRKSVRELVQSKQAYIEAFKKFF